MKLFIDEREYCDAAILTCGEVLLRSPEMLAAAIGAALDVQLTKAVPTTLPVADRRVRRYELRGKQMRLAVTPAMREPESLIFKVTLDEVFTAE